MEKVCLMCYSNYSNMRHVGVGTIWRNTSVGHNDKHLCSPCPTPMPQSASIWCLLILPTPLVKFGLVIWVLCIIIRKQIISIHFQSLDSLLHSFYDVQSTKMTRALNFIWNWTFPTGWVGSLASCVFPGLDILFLSFLTCPLSYTHD